MHVEESEFKGNKVLVLRNQADDKYPFSFGLQKAKMILEAIDDIKAFVAKNDKYLDGSKKESS